ncbi:MAG: cytochrome b/b6 domain-containing protein [Leptolyngbyaceae cyanobacterium CSU_1_3]|nr:cytochrome b/b6 domain-containing protein [Leptolyngbyaceae cyanobacterium CSU_1_3]
MDTSQRDRPPVLPKQSLFAKAFHWVNVVSLSIMLTSGLQIYNANPVFGGRAGLDVPPIFLLGGWLAGGRDWHFFGMWLFSLNLLSYGGYILLSRRWKHRFVGSSDFKALQIGKNPKRKAYAWHRIIYTAIVPVLLLSILSGMGMYKPAQLPWIVDMFGDWQSMRVVHFMTVPIAIGFAIVHSLLALKVGGSPLIESMFWRRLKTEE